MEQIMGTALLMMEGAQITLEIFCVTLLLSLPLGLLVALCRISKLGPLRLLMEFYIWLMRGTPLMLQLLFVYFALPMVGIRLPDIAAALLAFTLNYAAYFAEIFRGGIDTIPKGQYEAAKVLKFTPGATIRYIVLPQVTKIVLPSVFNEIMSLVKDTSLVYALGISDLILASRTAANRDASLVPMFLAGAIYLIVIGIITLVAKRIEKKFSYYK